ncbi:MAG: type III pantothenate kinase [Eubacterium sp.]
MILGIDIGNTSIEFALLHENGRVERKCRIATEKEGSHRYYQENIKAFIEKNSVSEVIISSVVPEINSCIKKVCTEYFGKEPLFITSRLNTGLHIRYDDPEKLGADLITAAAGAAEKYNLPLIVADIGTATTFSVINKNREYLGGMIAAGPLTSMKALAAMASQLPETEIMTASEQIIGTNTEDCIKIGTVTAHAAMIDGMIERVKKSLGISDITVIATGGFAEKISSLCHHQMIADENLIFTGMYEIYLKMKAINKSHS